MGLSPSTHHVLRQAGEQALVESFCRDLFNLLFSLKHSGYKIKAPVYTVLLWASFLLAKESASINVEELTIATANPPHLECARVSACRNSLTSYYKSLEVPCYCCESHK